MANKRKSILMFKVETDNIIINIDAATSQRERDKITAAVYRVLSYYNLDYVVNKKNISNYYIEGLANLSYYKDIIQDIETEYLEWYLERPGAI